MAEDKKTPAKAPEVLEAATRAEMVKVIGDYVAQNPGTKVSAVQYDGSKEKPYWVNLTHKS